MTLIKFEKNINCTNSVTCNNNILEIFEKKLNVLLHLEKDIDKAVKEGRVVDSVE